MLTKIKYILHVCQCVVLHITRHEICPQYLLPCCCQTLINTKSFFLYHRCEDNQSLICFLKVSVFRWQHSKIRAFSGRLMNMVVYTVLIPLHPNRDTFSGSFSLHCGAAWHHWGVFFWMVSILLQSPLTNSWAALNQLWWKWWIHRSPEYADVLFWDKVRIFWFRQSLSGLFSLQCGAKPPQRKTVFLCESLAFTLAPPN